MKSVLLAACLLLGGAWSASSADLAAPPPPYAPPPASSWLSGWYTHVGIGGLVMSESAKMDVAGFRFPGATIEIKPVYTVMFEVGKFLTPNWAVSFSGGLPPTGKIDGDGALDGMGRLGSTVYGPVSLTAHYHFTQFGRFQPYIGAGPVALLVFDTKDGLMTNLDIDNSIGVGVQVGADFMIDQNWGLYVDVKKAYLRTDAKGFVGGAPASAKVVLDPLVFNAGVTYRF